MRIKIDPLDKMFSLYIRRRPGWRCERCGTQYKPPTSALHCSHFFGRSNQKVRYDSDNANAHCYGCHQYLGSHPVEFTFWKRNQLGDKKFEALNRRANWRSGKVDKKLIKLWLMKELNLDEPKKEKEPKICVHKMKAYYCALCMPRKKSKKFDKEKEEE